MGQFAEPLSPKLSRIIRMAPQSVKMIKNDRSQVSPQSINMIKNDRSQVGLNCKMYFISIVLSVGKNASANTMIP